MTQIPLRCDGSPPEWAFLELQGVVTCRAPESEKGGLRGQELGTMLLGNLNQPTLRIGNQLCEGKETKLPLPMLICRKRKKAPGETQSCLEVVGVLRQKCLFNERPQPIVENSA